MFLAILLHSKIVVGMLQVSIDVRFQILGVKFVIEIVLNRDYQPLVLRQQYQVHIFQVNFDLLLTQSLLFIFSFAASIIALCTFNLIWSIMVIFL